jgi:hypothetical protein
VLGLFCKFKPDEVFTKLHFFVSWESNRDLPSCLELCQKG